MGSEKKSKKVIIVAHSDIAGITISQQDCRNALPAEYQYDAIFVALDIPKYQLEKLYDAPFEQLARVQYQKYKLQIESLLKQEPDSIIAYFGFTSIPAGFHLGFLLGNYPHIWVYHHHHTSKNWYRVWKEEKEPEKDFQLLPLSLPCEVQKGRGDVFIRISTSYRIEPQDTQDILNAPMREFDIALEKPHIDAVSNPFRLNEVVDAFQMVLTSISNYLPHQEKIHLFMSVATGIPFILGTKINLNIFPRIQTYQFSRDMLPRYKKAILIRQQSDELPNLTPDEIKIANKLRKEWKSQLSGKIHGFVKNLSTDSWYVAIQVEKINLMPPPEWINLPNIEQTTLASDIIGLEVPKSKHPFEYDKVDSTWRLDNNFLSCVQKRFKKISRADSLQAGRLFLFHEGLHYSPKGHNMNEALAESIGRFPKVIEKADYQADVWAIFHEYKYSSIHDNSKINNSLKKFFLDTIDTAVETMWSFMDYGKLLTHIPIRKMNRFLNWYWQYVRIEALKSDATLQDIANILFEQPTIEFAGSEITLDSDTDAVLFKLSKRTNRMLELAIFYKNKLRRFSPTGIEEMVNGFAERDGEKLKQVLRNFHNTLV